MEIKEGDFTRMRKKRKIYQLRSGTGRSGRRDEHNDRW